MLFWLMMILVAGLYLIPIGVALKRQGGYRPALVGLFLGWTVLGWAIAVIWALQLPLKGTRRINCPYCDTSIPYDSHEVCPACESRLIDFEAPAEDDPDPFIRIYGHPDAKDL